MDGGVSVGAAAVGTTATHPSESFCGGLGRIRGMFLVVLLYGCIVGARTAVRFAYLRTTVVCDTPQVNGL